MKNHRQLKHNAVIRLLAGWCGLLLYAGVFSPIGMGVVAVLGTIDPDHHALLQPGVDGMRVVLHHEGDCSTHKHHTVARALSFFAQPVSETDPDHVVEFGGGDSLLRSNQSLITGEDSVDPLPTFLELPVLFSSLQPVRLLPPPGPPPKIVGDILNVRFTVLLI